MNGSEANMYFSITFLLKSNRTLSEIDSFNDANSSPATRPKLNVAKDAKADHRSSNSNGKNNDRCKPGKNFLFH